MDSDSSILTTREQDPTVYSMAELVAWDREALPTLDREKLKNTSPHTVAQYLERLDVDERRQVLRKLDTESVSAILSEMDEELAAETVSAMRERRAVQILEDFEPDDLADIVGEMEDEDRDRFLGKFEPDYAEEIRDLLTYESDTAGGIMNPDVGTAGAEMTVDEAIHRIREFADEHEDLHYVYVIDEERRLVGAVSLRKLIQSRPWQRISEVMNGELRGVVRASADQEEAARLMAEYNLPDIAVVDDDERLVGVITHDDVIDILREEATEDIQLLAGAGGDESVHDPLRYSMKKRNPWLQVNLVTAFLAAGTVMLFQSKIGQLPVLAAFMPIIASLGGNAGQQALAVAIRSIALGEVEDTDGRRICTKEMLLGLCNGIAIGIVGGIIASAITRDWRFGAVVLVAMILNMAIAGLSGAFIPLMLRKLKFDPAQSASIFLTAITDVAGFFIFLSLGASVLL